MDLTVGQQYKFIFALANETNFNIQQLALELGIQVSKLSTENNNNVSKLERLFKIASQKKIKSKKILKTLIFLGFEKIAQLATNGPPERTKRSGEEEEDQLTFNKVQPREKRKLLNFIAKETKAEDWKLFASKFEIDPSSITIRFSSRDCSTLNCLEVVFEKLVQKKVPIDDIFYVLKEMGFAMDKISEIDLFPSSSSSITKKPEPHETKKRKRLNEDNNEDPYLSEISSIYLMQLAFELHEEGSDLCSCFENIQSIVSQNPKMKLEQLCKELKKTEIFQNNIRHFRNLKNTEAASEIFPLVWDYCLKNELYKGGTWKRLAHSLCPCLDDSGLRQNKQSYSEKDLFKKELKYCIKSSRGVYLGTLANFIENLI